MSPFDIFVLAAFIIATFKAVTDAIEFWKESEELATAHYRAADARRAANQARHQAALTRRASNISPKHLPVPCRAPRVPANRGVVSATTKSRAVRTGLQKKTNVKKPVAA